MKKILFLILLLTVWALPVAGHGTSLSLNKKQAGPGDTIVAKGAGLGKNAAITITLEGILNTYPLGEARGNDHGEFEMEIVIPADLKPGSYTVKAQAGDDSASAPLKIVRGVSATAEERQNAAPHEEETPAEHEMDAGEGSEEHATLTEPLQLNRSSSGSETAAVWGLILVSVLAGSLLWFKN